jgi:hypothetical protein
MDKSVDNEFRTKIEKCRDNMNLQINKHRKSGIINRVVKKITYLSD